MLQLKFDNNLIYKLSYKDLSNFSFLKLKFIKVPNISIQNNINSLLKNYNLNYNDNELYQIKKIISIVFIDLIKIYNTNKTYENKFTKLPLKTYEIKLIFENNKIEIFSKLNKNINNPKLFVARFNLILDLCKLFKMEKLSKIISCYFVCYIINQLGYSKMLEYLNYLK